jgi:predicted permease
MLVFILLQVILPILILIIVGALIQIKFTFDLKQLSTLITYCLMPAAVFINIIDIKVNTTVMMRIISLFNNLHNHFNVTRKWLSQIIKVG